jgi:hypothetical protein
MGIPSVHLSPARSLTSTKGSQPAPPQQLFRLRSRALATFPPHSEIWQAHYQPIFHRPVELLHQFRDTPFDDMPFYSIPYHIVLAAYLTLQSHSSFLAYLQAAMSDPSKNHCKAKDHPPQQT